MLQDRLVAGGSSGTATVTINTASLNRVNDTAVGNISVQIAVVSADGRRSGYTQAIVTRTRTLPDDTSDAALRAFLYTMTSDLVNAENVELEYNIRQHLAAWLVGGTSPVVGGPAAPAPVQAEPLSGPGAPAMGAPALGAPTPLGEPAVPSTMPPMPVTTPPGDEAAPTMPSGDLGLPQGNPVPEPMTAPPPSAPPSGPVSLTPPAPPGAAPSPAEQLVPSQPPAAAPPPPVPAPKPPPPPANPGTLPPLPPTITP
jgi:hypothetical protein